MGKVAVSYALTLAIAAAIGLVSSPALQPRSVGGWVGLGALMLALACVGEWAWGRVLALKLFKAQSATRISLARILVLLLLMLPFYAILVGASWLSGAMFR